MYLKRTIPKDRSDFVYFDDVDKELVSTKPLLLFYYTDESQQSHSFVRAQYVHSRKLWIDMDGFGIYEPDPIGWIDIKEEIKI